jgi:hypothetical protein
LTFIGALQLPGKPNVNFYVFLLTLIATKLKELQKLMPAVPQSGTLSARYQARLPMDLQEMLHAIPTTELLKTSLC